MSLSILNRLRENPALFTGRKVLVMGDIAFDRTFLCREPADRFHAQHGHERQYDIEAGGDDFGAVGTSNNYCLLLHAFKALPTLITAYGDDEEGRNVERLLKTQPFPYRAFVLRGVQTVTRLRFFIYSRDTKEYHLQLRVNKEPQYDESYAKVERAITDSGVLTWLQSELQMADALVLNDTEKGVFSDHVVAALSTVVRKENSVREASGRQPLITLIDPKYTWDRFRGFPTTVMKSNDREASFAVGLQNRDIEDPRELADCLYHRFGDHFSNIITTRGPDGATWLNVTSSRQGDMYRFESVAVPRSQFHVATHCGDMFGAAIVLALACGEDLFSAIPFANYCGAIQYTKASSRKIAISDILDPWNLQNLYSSTRYHEKVAEVSSPKQTLVNAILQSVGRRLPSGSGRYAYDGKASSYIATGAFAAMIDEFVKAIKHGTVLFIDGESGAGKGGLLDNLGIFVPGYSKGEDCFSASTVLDTDGRLEEVVRAASRRRTCLVLDEMQGATDGGIAKVLSMFPGRSFNLPFCLICAGHYEASRPAMADLRNRCSLFLEIPPFRDERRRPDIPYLVRELIEDAARSTGKSYIGIHAYALRELVCGDYARSNIRGLHAAVTATCHSSGTRVEWEHIPLEHKYSGATKKPQIPLLDYYIELV